jgi:hypothetical protein
MTARSGRCSRTAWWAERADGTAATTSIPAAVRAYR